MGRSANNALRVVPKAQRRYDSAQMAALLGEIADEVQASNDRFERLINRPLVVPEIMRNPQAAVEDMKKRESIFEDPKFLRIAEVVNENYIFVLPDDLDLDFSFELPDYPVLHDDE